MTKSLLLLLLLAASTASAFVVSPVTQHRRGMASRLQMVDPSHLASTGIMLAETEEWVQPAVTFLDPFLNFMSFAMLCRVVLSWYPEMKVNEFPWLVITLPTQGLLRAVRDLVPPAFGVDITPIFWLAIFTFIHEILLGQQGLLTLKLKYGI
ncbi:YGGT family [Seminavis robusta]|uniref:YGGT family n=1 Tax=Seminavis robusta TaxID=568900 RepID=A0A9N8EB87_9STRA|nr:YGGT family [Seminavis robusta]|eukprot:Sro915_g219680.1 YGGT family (152) ;mRNA; f:9770-10575